MGNQTEGSFDIAGMLASLDDTPASPEPVQLPLFPAFDYETFEFPKAPAASSCEDEQKRMTVRLRNGDKKVFCGACGQQVGIHGRLFNKSYAASLVLLVAQYEKDQRWYHVKEFNCTGGGDYAKLMGYGFIEKRSNDDPDKTSSGNFRPTPLGIEAAHGRKEFPKYAFWFEGVCFGFGEEMVSIDNCTKKFSIQDFWSDAKKKLGSA